MSLFDRSSEQPFGVMIPPHGGLFINSQGSVAYKGEDSLAFQPDFRFQIILEATNWHG